MNVPWGGRHLKWVLDRSRRVFGIVSRLVAARHCGCNGSRVSLIKSERVHLEFNQKPKCTGKMIEPIIVLIAGGVSAQSEAFPVRGRLIGVSESTFTIAFISNQHKFPPKQILIREQKLCHCVVSFHRRVSVMSRTATSPPFTHDLRRDFDKSFLTQQLWWSFAQTNWFATCDSNERSCWSCCN